MLKNKPFDIFTLQWHITNSCQLRCKHCYVDFSNINSISIENFTSALNNYINFIKYFWIKWKIYYTWWDPLLHKNFWEIIDITKSNNIDVSLFWNFHLLNEDNIQKLFDKDIKFYQLSMEWLKEVHDNIRWIWTFDGVVDAIQKLETKWINTLVNMTISKLNKDKLIPLIEYLAYNTMLSRFDFVRVVPMWKSSKDIILSDSEFKSLLLEILKLEEKIKNDWKKLIIWKKDHLWKLLYYENDKLKINLDEKAYWCWMVYRHLTVIETWDIYICRKLPIKIWNIITDDLIDMYENSEIVSNILNMQVIEGCNGCNLEKICRWCPAVTYWLYKSFQKDPQCWIK